jgi:hypothetical protein
MATVIAFGRVAGKFVYQYGPRSFAKDWGGVFKGLEITRILLSLPHAKHTPHEVLEASHIHEAGKVAQGLKRDLLIRDLSILTPEIAHFIIEKEIVHLLRADESSREVLIFSPAPEEPVILLTNCLSKMGLNTWGVLYQICMALAKFTGQSLSDGNHLCMDIRFTL